MYERNMDETDEKVVLPVDLEVFLAGREEPLRPRLTFVFKKEHLGEDDSEKINLFMGIVSSTLTAVLDDRTEPRFVLSDEKSNKFMIQTDQVQAINLYAPTEEIWKALEENLG